MSQMTHRERLEGALSGGDVDRTPISLWRHFGGIDMDPEPLTEAMVGFQSEYDWDFVKFMPTGTYSIIDWGAETTWTSNEHGIRAIVDSPIKSASDWSRLEPLDTTEGTFGFVNEALAATVKRVGPETPVLQTIFSPLATARKLGGPDTLAHLRQRDSDFAAGMSVIADVTRKLMTDAVERGADIFYVMQSGTADVLTRAEYETYERDYAQQLLGALPGETVTVLHAHGDNLWFEDLAELPVQGLNWHDQVGRPTLAQARQVSDKGLLGGFDGWASLRNGTPHDVQQTVKAALSQVDRGIVLAPGCIIATDSAPHLIRAARNAVEAVAS